MSPRDLAVIVVAAGRGERLGAAKPKAFVEIQHRTILEHSLASISQLENLAQLIVAVPDTHLEEATEIVHSAVSNEFVEIDVVVGGASRQQSISNALAAVNTNNKVVLVHDAARAFASADLFRRVDHKVRETHASVIPAIDIADTIKRVDGKEVLDTVDRTTLRAAQTPQGFVTSELLDAYLHVSEDFTDDAALVQSRGGKVSFVPGESIAEKITTAEDLANVIARLGASGRSGIGVDVHRFSQDTNKQLYLGTIVWPGVPGLEGHSDGDAVSHAIVDALLAAAGLGDIGSNFGVDRAEFAGANGSVFITETVAMLASAGYRISNVSVQVIGNRPKISSQRVAAESALSNLVGAPVSLGATTTDGLGFLGSDEGIAAVATAFIVRDEARLTS